MSTPIIDAHLDLAWNAVAANRDITRPLAEIRELDAGVDDFQGRREATVCLPEMRRGNVRLCLATVMGRSEPQGTPHLRTGLGFRNPEITSAFAASQWDYYRLLEKRGEMRNLRSGAELRAFWDDPQTKAIGYIFAMEGADSVLDPADLERWFERGLRVLGLAHYGMGVYAFGTGVSGPLRGDASGLLRKMRELKVILDATHLSDPSFFEALDTYDGPVLASHQNCRRLVPGKRQFSDEQLQLLIARGAVIGAAFDNWMLAPGWELGRSDRRKVTMENVADHIDHVCQLAGNDRHAAIGSDLDGTFGTEQSPADVQKISDVRQLETILLRRGYSLESVGRIFHANWLEFFLMNLPPT